jgi:hypothetical protein
MQTGVVISGVPPVTMSGLDASGVEPVVSVEADAYAAIRVPAGNGMYHHLMQTAKEVVALGASGVAAYKRTVVAFNNLLSFQPGSLGVMPTPLAGAVVRPPLSKPTKKRGRTPNADLINISALSRKAPGAEQKKGRRCSTCMAAGKISTDHRKGGNCPFKSQSAPVNDLTVISFRGDDEADTPPVVQSNAVGIDSSDDNIIDIMAENAESLGQ